MKTSRAIRLLVAGLAGLAASLPLSVSACAACFGKSDGPMAKGMNAGIFTLLFVITSVLLLIAVFFAYILRRAARLAAAAAVPVAGAVPVAFAPSAASVPSVAPALSQPTQ